MRIFDLGGSFSPMIKERSGFVNGFPGKAPRSLEPGQFDAEPLEVLAVERPDSPYISRRSVDSGSFDIFGPENYDF